MSNTPPVPGADGPHSSTAGTGESVAKTPTAATTHHRMRRSTVGLIVAFLATLVLYGFFHPATDDVRVNRNELEKLRENSDTLTRSPSPEPTRTGGNATPEATPSATVSATPSSTETSASPTAVESTSKPSSTPEPSDTPTSTAEPTPSAEPTASSTEDAGSGGDSPSP